MNKFSVSTKISVGDYECKDCGWPVIFACCNHPFTIFKDAPTHDWWLYCSDKGCKNHDGEGIFQDIPDWVKVL